MASCVQIPRAIGAFYHVWKWHNVQRARSEICRCTTHALYQSKLWQQDHCQHPQNANPDGSTLEGTAQCIGRPFGWLRLWSLVWFQVRAISYHLTSSKSAWKSTPKCSWMCWRMWWAPGAIRLGFRRSATTLYPSFSGPSPPPTGTRWTTSFGHTSITSPTWPPTTPKPLLIAAIRRVFTELPPALMEKACSLFRIQIEAVFEAEGGYIE